MIKKVVVLGSTGSIGTQALKVLEAHPDKFELLALSAGGNVSLLAQQATQFQAKYVGIAQSDAAKTLRDSAPKASRIEEGKDANAALAALPEADIVLIGISGMEGLPALLAALQAGKTVALANKESIVCGHPLVQEALKTHGGQIIPVDSEHSALFQCLQNGGKSEVAALHITASGGPFWQLPQAELENVTREQALCHPVWKMGKKITIDSATLMNKGLEVIEASYLFDIPHRNIFVLIHPQSIVHSMVEYKDGTNIAQLSAPDMRLAIQYALTYPAREDRQIERLSLAKLGSLTFFDGDAFPAICLAKEALAGGGTLPVAFCAANDVAVERFLNGEIRFADILRTVEHAMKRVGATPLHSYADVMESAQAAKSLAAEYR